MFYENIIFYVFKNIKQKIIFLFFHFLILNRNKILKNNLILNCIKHDLVKRNKYHLRDQLNMNCHYNNNQVEEDKQCKTRI